MPVFDDGNDFGGASRPHMSAEDQEPPAISPILAVGSIISFEASSFYCAAISRGCTLFCQFPIMVPSSLSTLFSSIGVARSPGKVVPALTEIQR